MLSIVSVIVPNECWAYDTLLWEYILSLYLWMRAYECEHTHTHTHYLNAINIQYTNPPNLSIYIYILIYKKLITTRNNNNERERLFCWSRLIAPLFCCFHFVFLAYSVIIFVFIFFLLVIWLNISFITTPWHYFLAYPIHM